MSDNLMKMVDDYGVLRYRMGCSMPATSHALAKESELLLANISDHIATLEQESAANLQRALVAENVGYQTALGECHAIADAHIHDQGMMMCLPPVSSAAYYIKQEISELIKNSARAPDTSTQEVG